MTDIDVRVAANLAAVKMRIAEAATRAGRAAGDVRLVAVTKYAPEPAVRAIIAAGCTDLGESRPQDLWDRATRFDQPDLRWHFIGHLQRNKIRRTLGLVSLLHSIDSKRLLAALNQEAEAADRSVDGLLEINISGDAAKHGLLPEQLPAVLQSLTQFPCVAIRGLMGMASLTGGLDMARRNFAALRMLRDKLIAGGPPGVRLPELSMGMSGDFEVAIEEGATIVRVGSALFEGID
jgi:pyridoxal phosphate enzyme (YggS family)